jgi:hypothetical protein
MILFYLQNHRNGAKSNLAKNQNKTPNQPVTKKNLDMDLDNYMKLTKSSLDNDLDKYMSKSKAALDNDLDQYMAQG